MEKEYRRAIVRVSIKLVESVLNGGVGDDGYIARPTHGLQDIKIVQVTMDPSRVPGQEVLMVIESPSLVPVKIGEMMPNINLTFQKIRVDKDSDHDNRSEEQGR
jgi:hypothetical protein